MARSEKRIELSLSLSEYQVIYSTIFCRMRDLQERKERYDLSGMSADFDRFFKDELEEAEIVCGLLLDARFPPRPSPAR